METFIFCPLFPFNGFEKYFSKNDDSENLFGFVQVRNQTYFRGALFLL